MARKMHRRSGKRKSSRGGALKKKKHSYSKRYHRKGRGEYAA